MEDRNELELGKRQKRLSYTAALVVLYILSFGPASNLLLQHPRLLVTLYFPLFFLPMMFPALSGFMAGWVGFWAWLPPIP